MNYTFWFALLFVPIFASSVDAFQVKAGDVITPDKASLVSDLVSPGNLILVKQGMRMKIVPTERLEWPPPYKSATEKYSPQVKLNDRGQLENYVAGLPFPLLDPNDPQAATKVMWNFSFRPGGTDDVDIRDVEIVTYPPAAGMPAGERFLIGHAGFYSNVGRTEVPPIPTDPEAQGLGIRYRSGSFPFLEPAEIAGMGVIRYRHTDSKLEDNTWVLMPGVNRVRQLPANVLSDVEPPSSRMTKGVASYVSNLDPDSGAGFSAKIEDFSYRLLGVKPMLASVHAETSPAKPCEFDNRRTVCPENWEMRQLYIVEATAKPQSWSQKIGSDGLTIPRRVFYVDSEGWFITASDQYDRSGTLWKTIATFNAYRDRPVPDAAVAIYPFKRMFQVALVDEDIQSGYSTVVYMPGHDTAERECWYINMGVMNKSLLDPNQLVFRTR